jgi:hypothetical protein
MKSRGRIGILLNGQTGGCVTYEDGAQPVSDTGTGNDFPDLPGNLQQALATGFDQDLLDHRSSQSEHIRSVY